MIMGKRDPEMDKLLEAQLENKDASPEELIKVQLGIIDELKRELGEQQDAAASMCNLLVCLVHMRLLQNIDVTANAVLIPREIVDRMEGAKVFMQEDRDRNVVVMFTERAPVQLRGV